MKYVGPLIDSHIHIRGGFEDLDAFISGMEQLRIQSGADAVLIAAVPLWDAECIGQNIISMLQKTAYPAATYVFAGFDYHLPPGVRPADFATQARELLAMGADGLKMLEGKPNIRKQLGNLPLNSPLFDDFYGFMEREQKPLLLHAADPASFWDDRTLPDFARNSGWSYADGTFAAKEQIHAETEAVLERFPGLKVSLAHFYFISDDLERTARLLERFPNVSLDITPGTEMFADFSARRNEWRDFFTHYSRRILFGTDNGWGTWTAMADKIIRAADFVSSIRRFLETADTFAAFTGFNLPVTGLDLDPDTLADIYYRNFIRFASETPRPPDTTRLIAYTEKMIAIFRGIHQPAYDLALPQMEACLQRLLQQQLN